MKKEDRNKNRIKSRKEDRKKNRIKNRKEARKKDRKRKSESYYLEKQFLRIRTDVLAHDFAHRRYTVEKFQII